MRIDLDESRLDRGKNKVPKAIYVASVGPALSVKGGVTRVIELIGVHLPEHICVRFIATFTAIPVTKGPRAPTGVVGSPRRVSFF
jgi:hypothetical protein